jgi:uncharacterized protein (DUF433 family)
MKTAVTRNGGSKVCAEKLCIRGTRLYIAMILDALAEGGELGKND